MWAGTLCYACVVSRCCWVKATRNQQDYWTLAETSLSPQGVALLSQNMLPTKLTESVYSSEETALHFRVAGGLWNRCGSILLPLSEPRHVNAIMQRFSIPDFWGATIHVGYFARIYAGVNANLAIFILVFYCMILYVILCRTILWHSMCPIIMMCGSGTTGQSSKFSLKYAIYFICLDKFASECS